VFFVPSYPKPRNTLAAFMEAEKCDDSPIGLDRSMLAGAYLIRRIAVSGACCSRLRSCCANQIEVSSVSTN
jgi:hypothetical protein